MAAAEELYPYEYCRLGREAGLPEAWLNDGLADRLRLLAERLSEGDRRCNLTAIREPRDVLVKHMIDSLKGAQAAAELLEGISRPRVLDVGAGGGFPSLPMAAALPGFRLTALDATAKKCDYIEETAAAAGLANVAVINARAEEWAWEEEGSYDLVISRAVGGFRELTELCGRFLRIGGFLVAMKGPAGAAEAEGAGKALKVMGLSPAAVRVYSLPEGAGERTLLTAEKKRPSGEGYPRAWAKMLKKPL